MADAPMLKPCPFCGGTVTLRKMIPRYDDAFVYCDECGIEGRRCDTDAQAIAAWNTRADLIDMDVLRRVEAALMRNHTWHLSQTEPIDMGGVEIVPAEAYSESAMCNATEAALADLRAIMGKLK